MLILARKIGERIKIKCKRCQCQCFVMSTGIDREKVKFGLDGDRDEFTFLREEVEDEER